MILEGRAERKKKKEEDEKMNAREKAARECVGASAREHKLGESRSLQEQSGIQLVSW